MYPVDTTNRREQRKFGITMAIALVLLGFIRWGFSWWRLEELPELPWAFILFAAAFLVLGLIIPKALQPVYRGWMILAHAINWMMTHILLTFVFVLLVIPTGVYFRILGKEPLKRKWLPRENSYWEDMEEQTEDIKDYMKQF